MVKSVLPAVCVIAVPLCEAFRSKSIADPDVTGVAGVVYALRDCAAGISPVAPVAPVGPVAPVAPLGPAGPVAPVAPVAPWGMTKSKVAACGVPLFVTEACVFGSPVVTVPTASVAAVPSAPVGPVGPVEPCIYAQH